MLKRITAGIALSLLLAMVAGAQTTVRGQVYMPNGELPKNSVRFYLQSGDGRVNEYRYTDSNGRFILERLGAGTTYTMTFESDGTTYETTVREFTPQYESTPRVLLKPFAAKPAPAKTSTDAQEMYETAMKELEKNNLEAAEKHLRKALLLDPTFSAALNDLGVLLMQKKNYAEAERILRRAVTLDPASVHALLNLGITLNHLGRYADALEPLRHVLELQPGLVAAHVNLGVALVELERFVEAERELLRGVKSGGAEEVPAQLYLGKLYARTGEFQKAIAAFEIYLNRAPDSMNAPEVRQIIERMRREMRARN